MFICSNISKLLSRSRYPTTGYNFDLDFGVSSFECNIRMEQFLSGRKFIQNCVNQLLGCSLQWPIWGGSAQNRYLLRFWVYERDFTS